jgi:hypothetical protein
MRSTPRALISVLASVLSLTLPAGTPHRLEPKPIAAPSHQVTLGLQYEAAYSTLMHLLVAKNYIILAANKNLGASQPFGFITCRTQSETESRSRRHDTILTGTLLLQPAGASRTQVEVMLTTRWQDSFPNAPFQAGVQEVSSPDLYRGFLEMISTSPAP